MNCKLLSAIQELAASQRFGYHVYRDVQCDPVDVVSRPDRAETTPHAMTMNRADFRFFDRLRVRWAEIDAQKIVFNGHYLMYVDTALGAYWRALALPYHDTMERMAGDLYVRKATLEYEGSARYDEQLDIGIRCARVGTTSLVFTAAVFRGVQRLVLGELVYVFADPATQKSQPVRPELRAVLQAFEAGEAMVDMRTGAWADLAADATVLRHAVFAAEQRIPAAMMVDDADAGAVHAVACNRLGMALASGRLLQPEPGLGQIGRMATLASVRGAGLGRQVLHALTAVARARGDTALILNAQLTAEPFYRAAGFVRSGEVFVEAGLPHVAMQRRLRD